MIKTRKNLRWFMIVILALFAMTIFVPVGSVIAEQSDLSLFERSDVFADLESIDGFDFRQYPKRTSGSAQLLNTVEYCYSENPEVLKYYGVYLYVYNPTCCNVLSLGNSVQMGVVFNDDGSVAKYEKMSLELLDVSDGEQNNLFLKFRVADSVRFLKIFGADKRRYVISGIELNFKPELGVSRLVDYEVGGYWEYTGFSKGCGADQNAESSLNCKIEQIETVKLDVYDSVYRTGENSNGKGHRTQVNSVAFSLPNRFLRDYGTLQRIEAEYYQFRTNPVVVTSEQGIYSAVHSACSTPIYGTNYDVCPYGFLSSDVNSDPALGSYWAYNANPPTYKTYFTMPNIFFSGCGDILNYVLPSDVLKEHIRNYPIDGENYYEIRSGKISSATVNPVVDEQHTTAYRRVVVDSSKDKFDLKAYSNGTPGGWSRFWSYLSGTTIMYPEVKDISPICILDEKSILSSADILSSALLWQFDKIFWLKSFCRESVSEDKSTVLFRFSSSDYFSTVLNVYKNGSMYLGDGIGDKTEAIGAVETIFLDFDILSLTFSRDGVFTVIPTVSSPIDVVGSIEPPKTDSNFLDKAGDWFAELWAKIKEFFSNNKNWWKWLLIGLAVLLLLPLVVVFMPYIIKLVVLLAKGLWWLICLPFRGIAWLVRWIKERCGK